MTESICDLASRHCTPCEGGTPPLGREEAERFLADLPGWELTGEKIEKSFAFKNYYQTMAFVNAVAWIAHGEDHHPDMELTYRTCRIRYTTHAIGGLSVNDFICAARVNALIADAG